MNVGDLKREIMGLAFEDEASMQDYKDLVNDAINRSIHEIHSTVKPILGTLTIEQQGSTKAYERYDMRELTRMGEDAVFMSFDGKVSIDSGSAYLPIQDYMIESRKDLLIPGKYDGVITVWYNRIPVKVAEDTLLTQELELDYEVQFLVPLLAAYYVWLDDDERKASLYYNRYEDLRQPFMERPTGTITGAMRW